MDPERWREIERLYHLAREREAGEREKFLAQACGSDEALRREVESLLARPPESQDFLEVPALEVAAMALAKDKANPPLIDLTGRTIAHYRVLAKIGEGGMGVVYKARDAHLDRTVAIKVLPPEAMSDLERRQRFIQEAKAASALNHPNIIDIHDINSDAGIDFIVMEHVSGKTLDQRIGRKGLRIGEALKYGAQIADALAAAHAAGIVHRDLKPANIMVTETGLVKILDFGLAKLTQPIQGEASGTVPSMESLTGEGRIMGTVAYMSPEQAEGKAVDARSDVFSFGSLLYKMLAGRQAFEGDSMLSTLSAILNREAPPLSADVPNALKMIVKRCMRKDPSKRFQHMDDVKVELEELEEESDSGTVETGLLVKAKARHSLVWAFGILAALAITAAGIWFVRSRAGIHEMTPTTVPLTSYPGFEGSPSFSPDGNQVAFYWCQEGQNCHIYIKQVGTESLMRLTNNSAAEISPSWSPDGRWIAFLRASKWSSDYARAGAIDPSTISDYSLRFSVVVIPPVPGPERVLTELSPAWGSISWSSDSRWIAVAEESTRPEPGPLWLVSLEGNERRQITFPPEVSQDSYPAFSPDGHRLAFFRCREADKSDLYLLELSDELKPLRDPRLLYACKTRTEGLTWTADGSSLVFATSTYSGVSHQLWRIAISGSNPPQRLDSVGANGFLPVISRRGDRMAYVNSTNDWNLWRMEVTSPEFKTSAPSKLVSTTRSEYRPQFSPDGKKIAFISDRSGAEEIWVCDPDGDNAVQLTHLGWDIACVKVRWSPDGSRLTFSASPDRENAIYSVNANGGSPLRLSLDPRSSSEPYWSRDGKWIFFGLVDSGKMAIFKLPAGGGSPVLVTDDPGWMPMESPDGKFIYYYRDESEGFSLWRVASSGGKPRKIQDLGLSLVEELRGEGAYVIERSDNSLRFFNIATDKAERIVSFSKPIMGCSVSPDGHQIVYGQLDQSGSDIMLVENFR